MKSLLLNLYNVSTLKVKAYVFKVTVLLNLHLWTETRLHSAPLRSMKVCICLYDCLHFVCSWCKWTLQRELTEVLSWMGVQLLEETPDWWWMPVDKWVGSTYCGHPLRWDTLYIVDSLFHNCVQFLWYKAAWQLWFDHQFVWSHGMCILTVSGKKCLWFGDNSPTFLLYRYNLCWASLFSLWWGFQSQNWLETCYILGAKGSQG